MAMASRTTPRALKASIGRLSTPTIRRQSLSTAFTVTRTARTPRPALICQQTRTIKTVDFAGTKETVYGALLVLTMSHIF